MHALPKGAYRCVFARPEGLRIVDGPPGEGSVRLDFGLPAGGYATSLLRELVGADLEA